MKKEFKISDSDLVKSYQDGNKEALPVLVKRWHLLFCKIAFFYVKDTDVAKDIAQESWITIFKKLDSIKEPEKSKSWAISLVNRKALDWLRKSNRERLKLNSFYEENTNKTTEIHIEQDKTQIREQLLMGISKLSINQQQVIQLFYREGYTLKEISTIMSTNINITKSRLFHARERLKTILKHRNYEK